MQDLKKIKTTADYLKTHNYALHHNRIPVCQAIEVTNVSEAPIEDVIVRCTGEFVSDYESRPIGCIAPGETVKISPYSINPDPSKLAAITERVATGFKLTALSGDTVLGEDEFDLELMPYDHWTGTGIMPQTLASFITPNNPAINSLIVKCAAILKQLTGSSALDAYQSGNPNEVRQQVGAVFAAIHDAGIVYRGVPASYEETGQRITMPDQVLASKTANCLELTLLMASVLEAIGINCLIILQKEHAYLGVWLVDDCCSCSVSDDPSYIEKKCSRGIGEMLVVECTHTAAENASLEEAIRTAELSLADHKDFDIFIDVKRSRLERILPLPTRMESNGSWVISNEGIGHDSCDIEVKEHDRYDLSRVAAGNTVLTKFDIWERKLLDFSLRNNLLNLSLRRRAIQFISFDINRIEDLLQDGHEYRITPRPNVEIQLPSAPTLIKSKLHEPLHELIATDIEHDILHTFLPEDDTKAILKNIHRAARNAIEESGANSLFLAIGTLRWYETERSATPRYAPLLLLPVEMVYKKGHYFIRTRDEEIMLNITLMEFLRQNYDISINGLTPLPLGESGVDVPKIFAIIRDALKEQKRWDVEEESLLGIFSFSKFLMWNDVHNHRAELAENKIISSLVANRLTWTPPAPAGNVKDMDCFISPADIALPVAVDSSQLTAVVEGWAGNSFILYGPPGTGKSQTITNLIANALYHGKRVLFVAEKMAALSVVQSRLEKIGLDPFCLELHSNKSTKRHVLKQLEKALNVVHIMPQSDYAKKAAKIFEKRKELIAYLTALHTPGEADGLSAYDCIARAESITEPPLKGFAYDSAIDTYIADEGIRGVEDLLGSRLPSVLRLTGQPFRHPLNGLRVDDDMLTDCDKTARGMKADAAALKEYGAQRETLTSAASLRQRLMRDNSTGILQEDPEDLRLQWRRAKAKWFIPRYFAKKAFIRRLKEYNPFLTEEETDSLIEDLIGYRGMHQRIADFNSILLRRFGLQYADDEVAPAPLLDENSAMLERWADNASLMRDWSHWNEISDELRADGMGSVVDALERGEVDPDSLKDSFLKALYMHKANSKTSAVKILARFEGSLFDEKIKIYRMLKDEFQQLTCKELYARLAAEVPRLAAANASNASEIGLLNRNISNGGRGLSLRDLFDKLPTLLPRLCPCMLMSPISVAQYIDLNSDKFDLVIFDEASQMPTSEAVGAIARGNALIVVGDPKQMPPTSFFSSTNVDAEEAGIDDMESILEDCRTLDMPSHQLSWHYRSRHESLIAFSNNEYYDGSLITFPSVDDKETKVHYMPVSGGFYDKGGRRCNLVEAEAIVNEITRRLRNPKLRKSSIGVIAFSVMQQGLIEDLLQDKLDHDRKLQEAAAAMHEPIFVKNLENVQGDERDVILFSIGYGPDKNGRISMNFGPLNNAGGERRLNVAVSRAREEMYVFSTLKSTDIDLRRSKARGVAGLKHFLQYAETQKLPTVSQTGLHHKPSPIAYRIAEELEKLGHTTAVNVGRSQFRVDVAVEDANHPGRYKLGILLDGERYRDTPTTRDREIVQPSVMESLDWKVMRVWSVDWIRNRKRVLERIIDRLNDDGKPNRREEDTPVFDLSKEKEEVVKSRKKKYRIFIPKSLVAERKMDSVDIIRDIVSVEQPITVELIERRLDDIRPRFLSRRDEIEFCKYFASREFYQDSNGTVWLSEEDSRNYPYYRTMFDREISEIPEIELINAINETLAEQVAICEQDLLRTASKKMEIPRFNPSIAAAFRKALEKMKREGSVVETAGLKLRLKPDL